MNKTIPNLIKQPSQCCIHCGKIYVKRVNLDKHIILCELLNRSKKALITQEDDEEIPSQRKIFQMLLELGNKFNKLEEKVEELNKWVIKKKKNINIIDWLNSNMKPDMKFDNLIEKIIINHEDVKYLMENSFYETLNKIFVKSIYIENSEKSPIFAFIQRTNIFYIYENEEIRWIELTIKNLIKFLNKVYMKLFRVFTDYKKLHADQINDDEKFSLLCDRTSVKLMSIDFREEATLGKIKSIMYSKMKTDMKGFIDPPVQGIHYLLVDTPEQVGPLIASISKEKWEMMSAAGKAWWKSHASAEGMFRLTWNLIHKSLPYSGTGALPIY